MSGSGLNAAITSEEAYSALLEEFRSDKANATRVGTLREERKEREAELAEATGDTAPVELDQVEPSVVEPTPADAEPVVEVPDEESPAPIAEEITAATEPEPPLPVEEPEAVQEVEPDVPEPAPPAAETPPDEPEEVVSPVDEAEPQEAAEEVDQQPVAEETPPEELSAAETPEADVPAKELPTTEEGVERPGGDGVIKAADRVKLQGTTVVGKLDLKEVEEKKPKPAERTKTKRKRIRKTAQVRVQAPPPATPAKRKKKSKKRGKATETSQETEQTKQGGLGQPERPTSRVRQRRRRERRRQRAEERLHESQEKAAQEKNIRVTEFVSTGELANLMGLSVTDVISTLFSAGMMVSINQRLDADTISFVADEFDVEVEFNREFGTDDIVMDDDEPAELLPRAPVVTVMGHVDHGKTSLLDYIRRASVALGESGGITQHIGAYKVKLDKGRIVTFLDTPGHEAFTAMRARGAKVTDVVILVVAANDAVMPQTIEAINHARAAEVSVIVAVNKMDLDNANPQRVMQQLADQGILVEQFGGQVQCAYVSAKTGFGVDDLLEKVLLEADIQELKGNPARRAEGIVIESRLERGRGNVATVLVQNGTLNVGDPFVAGIYNGRVRAMFDEGNTRIEKAGPSEPALVLGLPGQPTVGDQFIGFEDADEAKAVAQRRQQIWREQKMRQYKHVRLEDIGRRRALGDFNELNLIIKADVGGSVEAISDSLLKLSTAEVAVNIIHDGVGAINESDVMLASASDAVIIGFQVRPTLGARHAAEREEIDIHTYSIIYDAIEDVRDALEGLLEPEETEKVNAVVEVRDTFKVPKIGMVAGCYVTEGKVKRKALVRVLRESIVIYDGKIASLRRFKEDVREVVTGYECGIGIENYNDLKVGDQLEVYEVVEIQRTLEAA